MVFDLKFQMYPAQRIGNQATMIYQLMPEPKKYSKERHRTPKKSQQGHAFTYTWAKLTTRNLQKEPTRTLAYIHMYMHTYIHTYIHTYMHICVYMYICKHTYIHIYIYIYIYATPPLRSMDSWLLGRGRLRVFSNYLIQNAVSMKIP